MKIKVTQKHIKAGIRENERKCPIARAITEAIKKSCLPQYLRSIQVEVDDEVRVGSLAMNLSRKMEDFIAAFDAGEKVKPFSFDLKLGVTGKCLN